MFGQLRVHLHNFFIPHEGNGHLPHSVRRHSLLAYAFLMVALKVFAVLVLFASFPGIAEFSTITQARTAQLVNQARAQEGIPPVKVNAVLEQAAALKLQDMITHEYFAHTSPAGVSPWVWFKQAKYLYTFAGENLAMNFVDAEELHDAWMASPTHRANIMNPKYEEIGVAVGVGEIDGYTSTLVVQFFGTTYAPPVISEPAVPIMVKGEDDVKTTTEPSVGPPDERIFEPEPSESVTEVPQQPTPPEVIEDAPLNVPEEVQETSIQQPPTSSEDLLLPTDHSVAREPSITGGSQEVTLEIPTMSAFTRFILAFTQYASLAILIFVVFALLLKVFVRFHIQHRAAIILALAVIIAGVILLLLNIHFLQSVSGPVLLN